MLVAIPVWQGTQQERLAILQCCKSTVLIIDILKHEFCFPLTQSSVPLVLPQIIPFDFGEDQINSGDIVSLTCSVNKGDLPMEVTWSFNGRPISQVFGVTTNAVNKRLSTLSIDSVQAEHAGYYTCIAKNQAGSANYSAYLFVNGTNIDCLVLL